MILNKADINDDTAALTEEISGMRTWGSRLRRQCPDPPGTQGARTLSATGPHWSRRCWARPGSASPPSSIVSSANGVQDTQEVREADHKGRHTTTQRELVVAPSGVIVIDTPGMRELSPWDAGAGIDAAFSDVVAVAARCKFRDCTHTVEPGCAVQAALADGFLPPERWQAYLRMRRASAYEVRRVDRAAQQRQKVDFKKITKSLRQRVREKHGEE